MMVDFQRNRKFNVTTHSLAVFILFPTFHNE